MNIQRITEEDSIFWFDLCGWKPTEDHTLEMVFIRQKARADANPESPPKIKHKINIRELRTPSRKVFTQEQNELFVEQVV